MLTLPPCEHDRTFWQVSSKSHASRGSYGGFRATSVANQTKISKSPSATPPPARTRASWQAGPPAKGPQSQQDGSAQGPVSRQCRHDRDDVELSRPPSVSCLSGRSSFACQVEATPRALRPHHGRPAIPADRFPEAAYHSADAVGGTPGARPFGAKGRAWVAMRPPAITSASSPSLRKRHSTPLGWPSASTTRTRARRGPEEQAAGSRREMRIRHYSA